MDLDINQVMARYQGELARVTERAIIAEAAQAALQQQVDKLQAEVAALQPLEKGEAE